MTTRSIIDIDIRTQAWDEFQSAFNKYRKAVDDAPDAWAKVDKAVKASANPFKQIGAIFAGTNEQMRQAATAQEKLRIAATGTGKVFSTMGKSTATLAKNIKAVTLDLLRWASLTSVFSGLLGAGGLFGLNRLAASVSGARREAQGLGVSSGELQSARVNYQKLVDVDSVLSKINEAKQDVTKRYAFAAAGLRPEDWENQNSADILKTLVPQIKSTLARGDGSKQYADATGLTQFVDLETLNRLKSVTQAEIEEAQASYEADKKTLSLNEQTQRAWQNFQVQLTRAGSQIEMSFVRGLTGLTGPLSKLSAAIAHAVDIFLASPKIGEWIDKVGAALESFAKYLTSDDLEQDVKSFLEAVDTFAGSLWSVAKLIGKVFNFGSEQGLKASQYRKLEQLEKIDPKLAKEMEWALKNPNAAKAADTDMTGKTGTGMLSGLLANASPEARMLAKSLQDNTEATQSLVAINQRVKSQINLADVHTDKAALKAEADRQWREAFGNPASSNRAGGTPADFARAAQDKYGVSAAITLAQFQLESGGGKHMPAGSNNPFGIKARAGQDYVEAETTEYIGGVEQRVKQKFAKFDSVADAFDAYAKLLATSPAFKKARDQGSDQKAYVHEMAKVYATDPAYEAKLQALVDKLSVKGGAAGTDTASGSGGTAQSSGAPYRQPAPSSQPLAVNIYKAPGADVFTTVNGMGYSN